jgi:hypothetical protein
VLNISLLTGLVKALVCLYQTQAVRSQLCLKQCIVGQQQQQQQQQEQQQEQQHSTLLLPPC